MPKQFPDDVAGWKLGDTALCIAAQINEEPKIEAAIRSGKPTMVVAGGHAFLRSARRSRDVAGTRL
jgi:hypothetical protein